MIYLNHHSASCSHFPDEILKILQTRTQVTYYPKEIICKQGAFANHVLLLIDGLVRVFIQAGEEKQINVRLAQGGDYLAFSSIFVDPVYPFSAVALKETHVCMIEKEEMKQLLLDFPDFALNLITESFKLESRFIEIIYQLSSKQMRGKLAAALLYLSSDEFKNSGVLELLTRQELADFAQIGIESAIKFLKELEKEKVITIQGRAIAIENRNLLTDLCRKG